MAWFGGGGPPQEPTLQDMLGAFMATIYQAHMDASARGAINAQRTSEMMQFMTLQNAQINSQMAQGFQSMSANQGSGGSSDTASHGYRALKPKKDMTKVTADDARRLMNEISCFEVDLNELGIAKFSEAAYRQLRAMAEGKAKDVVDIETVQGRGKELLDQLTWATNNHQHQHARDDIGGRLYDFLVGRLEDSVRLNQTKRLTIAEEIYSEARMYEDTPKEAELFLSRWRRSRYLMHREGLVNKSRKELLEKLSNQGADAESLQAINHSLEINERREMHVFLHQRVSKSVYEFIMSQSEDEQARSIDDCISLIQKYCEVKARVLDKEKVALKVLEGGRCVVSMDGVPYAIDDPRISGSFQQLTEFSTLTNNSTTEEEPTPYCTPAVYALGRSADGSPAGHMGGKVPKSPGRDRSGQKAMSPPAGVKPCQTCHGFHEDLRTCPNGLAKQDPTYRYTANARCGQTVNGHRCEGHGHFGRHHRQQWATENPGRERASQNNRSPGQNLGGSGRYNGESITKRIVVLDDGTWLEDEDIDQADYEANGDVNSDPNSLVCPSCSPTVALPSGASGVLAAIRSQCPLPDAERVSSMTAGQRRAAQWSAVGLAGSPVDAQPLTCGSLREFCLEQHRPSCSRLARCEWNGCPTGTMGSTGLAIYQSSSISCQSLECPNGYVEQGLVLWGRIDPTGQDAVLQGESTGVTGITLPSFFISPRGVSSEKMSPVGPIASYTTSPRTIGARDSLGVSVRLDTTHARSDRSWDRICNFYYNSNPPLVVAVAYLCELVCFTLQKLASLVNFILYVWTLYIGSGHIFVGYSQTQLENFPKYSSRYFYGLAVQVWRYLRSSSTRRNCLDSSATAFRCGDAIGALSSSMEEDAEKIGALREVLRQNQILRENELVYALVALQDRKEERLRVWVDLKAQSPEAAETQEALDALFDAEENIKRLYENAFGEDVNQKVLAERANLIRTKLNLTDSLIPDRWNSKYNPDSPSTHKAEVEYCQQAIRRLQAGSSSSTYHNPAPEGPSFVSDIGLQRVESSTPMPERVDPLRRPQTDPEIPSLRAEDGFRWINGLWGRVTWEPPPADPFGQDWDPYKPERSVSSVPSQASAADEGAENADADREVTRVATRVEEFITLNALDERASRALRCATAEVQVRVLERRSLDGVRNPSAATMSRIKYAFQKVGRSHGYGRGWWRFVGNEEAVVDCDDGTEGDPVPAAVPEPSARHTKEHGKNYSDSTSPKRNADSSASELADQARAPKALRGPPSSEVSVSGSTSSAERAPTSPPKVARGKLDASFVRGAAVARKCAHPKCTFAVHSQSEVSTEYCCVLCGKSAVNGGPPRHGPRCEGCAFEASDDAMDTDVASGDLDDAWGKWTGEKSTPGAPSTASTVTEVPPPVQAVVAAAGVSPMMPTAKSASAPPTAAASSQPSGKASESTNSDKKAQNETESKKRTAEETRQRAEMLLRRAAEQQAELAAKAKAASGKKSPAAKAHQAPVMDEISGAGTPEAPGSAVPMTPPSSESDEEYASARASERLRQASRVNREIARMRTAADGSPAKAPPAAIAPGAPPPGPMGSGPLTDAELKRAGGASVTIGNVRGLRTCIADIRRAFSAAGNVRLCGIYKDDVVVVFDERRAAEQAVRRFNGGELGSDGDWRTITVTEGVASHADVTPPVVKNPPSSEVRSILKEIDVLDKLTSRGGSASSERSQGAGQVFPPAPPGASSHDGTRSVPTSPSPKVVSKPSSAPIPAPKPSVSATYALADAAVGLSFQAGQSVGSAIGAPAINALDHYQRARMVRQLADLFNSREVPGVDLVDACSAIYQKAIEMGLAPGELDMYAGDLLEARIAEQAADDALLTAGGEIAERRSRSRSRSRRSETVSSVQPTEMPVVGGAYTTGTESLSYSPPMDFGDSSSVATPPFQTDGNRVPLIDSVSLRPSSIVTRGAPKPIQASAAPDGIGATPTLTKASTQSPHTQGSPPSPMDYEVYTPFDIALEREADNDPALAAAIRLSLMPIDSEPAPRVEPADATGEPTEGSGVVDGPTLAESARATDAIYQLLGEEYIRLSELRGGRQVATAIRCPKATLWLSGENQVTGVFLRSCSVGVLVVSAMLNSPPQVAMACREAHIDPPIAFLVAHVPTHQARICEVLQQVFDALNSGRDVVIHCHAGRHRAASLVLVILMLGFRARLADARAYLKRIRPAVDIEEVFLRAGCNNEGRSLCPSTSDHFLFCYDQLIRSQLPQTPEEAWLHANCRLDPADSDERNSRSVAVPLPLGSADSVRSTGVSPSGQPSRRLHGGVLEIPEGADDYWDVSLGMYVSCIVCSGRRGRFVKCTRCASWVHTWCCRPDETFCTACHDKARDREEELKKLQRLKRFSMEADRARSAASGPSSAGVTPSPAPAPGSALDSANTALGDDDQPFDSSWHISSQRGFGPKRMWAVHNETYGVAPPSESCQADRAPSESAPALSQFGPLTPDPTEEYWRAARQRLLDCAATLKRKRATETAPVVDPAVAVDADASGAIGAVDSPKNTNEHLPPASSAVPSRRDSIKRAVQSRHSELLLQGVAPNVAAVAAIREVFGSAKDVSHPETGPCEFVQMSDNPSDISVLHHGPNAGVAGDISGSEDEEVENCVRLTAVAPLASTSFPANPGRRIFFVAITGPYGIGKSKLARSLSQRFSSPLGEIRSDFMYHRTAPLPDGKVTAYGGNSHRFHVEAYSVKIMYSFRERARQAFAVDPYCPTTFRVSYNGECLREEFAGAQLDASRPVIIIVTGSAMLLNRDLAKSFDLTLALFADEHYVLARRLKRWKRGQYTVAMRDRFIAAHSEVDWSLLSVPTEKGEYEYIQQHPGSTASIRANGDDCREAVLAAAIDRIKRRLRAQLGIRSAEEIDALLDRPAVTMAPDASIGLGGEYVAPVGDKGASKGSLSRWENASQQEARQHTSRTRANYAPPDAHSGFYYPFFTAGTNMSLPRRVTCFGSCSNNSSVSSWCLGDSDCCMTTGGTKEGIVLYSRPSPVRHPLMPYMMFTITIALWDKVLQFARLDFIKVLAAGILYVSFRVDYHWKVTTNGDGSLGEAYLLGDHSIIGLYASLRAQELLVLRPYAWGLALVCLAFSAMEADALDSLTVSEPAPRPSPASGVVPAIRSPIYGSHSKRLLGYVQGSPNQVPVGTGYSEFPMSSLEREPAEVIDLVNDGTVLAESELSGVSPAGKDYRSEIFKRAGSCTPPATNTAISPLAGGVQNIHGETRKCSESDDYDERSPSSDSRLPHWQPGGVAYERAARRMRKETAPAPSFLSDDQRRGSRVKSAPYKAGELSKGSCKRSKVSKDTVPERTLLHDSHRGVRIGEASHPGPDTVDSHAAPIPDQAAANSPPIRDRSRSGTRSISPTIPWDDEFLVFQERKRQLLLRLARLLRELRLVEEEFQVLVSSQVPMVRYDPRALRPYDARTNSAVARIPYRAADGACDALTPLEVGCLPGQVDLNRLMLGEVISFIYHQGERSGQRRCGAIISLLVTPSGPLFEMEERVENGPSAGATVRERYWPSASSGTIYSVQAISRERTAEDAAALREDQCPCVDCRNGVPPRGHLNTPTDAYVTTLHNEFLARTRRVTNPASDIVSQLLSQIETDAVSGRHVAPARESAGTEFPTRCFRCRPNALSSAEREERLESLERRVDLVRRGFEALTKVARITDRRVRVLSEGYRGLVIGRDLDTVPTTGLSHDGLRGVRIGEARHPGPSGSDSGDAQGDGTMSGADNDDTCSVRTDALSKSQKKKMKKKRASEGYDGTDPRSTHFDASPRSSASTSEPLRRSGRPPKRSNELAREDREEAVNHIETDFLWKIYTSSMNHSCLDELVSKADQHRAAGPVNKIQHQVDAMWVNLRRLAGFVVRGRSDHNLQAAQQVSQQIRGHMLDAKQELVAKIEASKIAVMQLQSNALSDLVCAESKALESITGSAKARMINLREIEDRVRGSLLAMEQQERNTLDAVDIACKIFDDKAETLDDIKFKQDKITTQLVRLQHAISSSEDRLEDMQDRMDRIPDQLRAHARSLHETLETRDADDHSGGGFCSTSVTVSAERLHSPVASESATAMADNTRGRSLDRQRSPQISTGFKAPSNHARHASPVVLEFYADMVTKDATVAESAHVRGRSVGSRRASSLVHYALREVSSRSISRENPVPEYSAATAKLREARHRRSRGARSKTDEESTPKTTLVDPTDALIATLLDHEHIDSAEDDKPSGS